MHMGEDQANQPAAAAVASKVKMEVDDATRFLELQMEEGLQRDESVDGDHSLDDFPPPVLQPEITLGKPMENGHGNFQTEGEGVQGSLWYQCKYCSVLVDEAMTFLFHMRTHEGCSDMNPTRLESQLAEAGVTIFSPAIVTPRVDSKNANNVTVKSEPTSVRLNIQPPLPMPRLTPALDTPATSTINPNIMTTSEVEDLQRQCKLCTPHLTFNKRSEFIDHLFMSHRVDREFHCSKPECSFKTRSVQFLEKHVDDHMDPKNRGYTCHLCLPKTRWLSSTRYAQHTRSHLQEDAKYHCISCTYTSASLQLFNKHVKHRHPPGASSRARILGTIPRPRALSAYPRPLAGKVPIDRQFLCYYCSNSWLSRKHYEAHMVARHRNSRGGYTCNQCKFTAESIRLIARHFRFKHDMDSVRNDFVQIDVEDDQDQDEGMANVTSALSPALVNGRRSSTPIKLRSSSPAKNPLCLPLTPAPNKATCPLCHPEPDNQSEISMSTKIFDHILQNHVYHNVIHCPELTCLFRSKSLETTIAHIVIAHSPSPLAPPAMSPPVSTNATTTTTTSPGKLTYLCRFCHSNWSEVTAYSQHMKQHLDVNGHYSCPYCKLPYPTLNRFNEHVKRRHESGQPIRRRMRAPSQRHKFTVPAAPPRPIVTVVVKTPQISKRVGLTSRRRRLIRGASGYQTKTFACFYCSPDGLGFTSVKHYSRHMRELHMNSDGTYICPICPSFKPNSLKKINEHMKRKTHPMLMKEAKDAGRLDIFGEGRSEAALRDREDPRDQKVDIGDDNDDEDDEMPPPLLREVKTELLDEEPINGNVEIKVEPGAGQSTVPKKWFQCKACFILVESKEKLVVHQKTHHQLSAPQVQPTVKLSQSPQQARADSSLSPVTPRSRASPLRLHRCNQCLPPKSFQSLDAISDHVAEYHPVTVPSDENGIAGPGDMDSGRKMTCLFCYIVFKKQTAYIKHMNDEHMDATGEFICPTCHVYSSPLLSRATKHIRRHFKPDKPYIRNKSVLSNGTAQVLTVKRRESGGSIGYGPGPARLRTAAPAAVPTVDLSTACNRIVQT